MEIRGSTCINRSQCYWTVGADFFLDMRQELNRKQVPSGN